MAVYDFKCEECGEEIEIRRTWSKTMADELEPCKCGEKKWRRLITVSHSKFKDPSKDEAVNQANEMMNGNGWT